MFKRCAVALSLLVVAVCLLEASGGGNGGGGNGGGGSATFRVTGYVTAINPVTGTITFGTSYYNTGTVKVSSSTKVVRNTVNSSAGDIRLGDYGQADVSFTWEAKKIEVTGAP